jgi:hypothetical protein
VRLDGAGKAHRGRTKFGSFSDLVDFSDTSSGLVGLASTSLEFTMPNRTSVSLSSRESSPTVDIEAVSSLSGEDGVFSGSECMSKSWSLWLSRVASTK